MDVWVLVGPKVSTSKDKEPTTTLGILYLHHCLNHSDKWININKIDSNQRLQIYS